MPLFVAGTKTTASLVAEHPNLDAAWYWIEFLAVYDGAFLVLSLLLSLMSAGTRSTTSELQQRLRTSAPAAGTAPAASPLPITPAPNGPPTGGAPAAAGEAGKTPPKPAPSKPAQ